MAFYICDTVYDIILCVCFFNCVDVYNLLGKGGYVFCNVGLSVCLWTTLLKKL